MAQNFNVNDILKSVPFSKGALAGLIATVPMTIFMVGMHRLLPKWQQYALPPERVTDEAAKRTEVKEDMDKQQRLGAALVAHFGFGTSMGALYSPVAEKVQLPPVVKGIGFGLAVWTASYLGMFNAIDMSEAATEQPVRRNILMIVAHVVWGATLGIVEDMLKR